MNDFELFLERKLIKLRTKISALATKINRQQQLDLNDQAKRARVEYNALYQEYYRWDRHLQQIRRFINGNHRGRYW